jgi:hypothetical protein
VSDAGEIAAWAFAIIVGALVIGGLSYAIVDHDSASKAKAIEERGLQELVAHPHWIRSIDVDGGSVVFTSDWGVFVPAVGPEKEGE